VSVARTARTIANIRSDWRKLVSIIDADDQVIRRAMDVVERYALRGYDAVHLAAALTLRDLRAAAGLPALVFVSADQEQLQAAVQEGFTVEDPNQHP
jgi:uncharacterized protein